MHSLLQAGHCIICNCTRSIYTALIYWSIQLRYRTVCICTVYCKYCTPPAICSIYARQAVQESRLFCHKVLYLIWYKTVQRMYIVRNTDLSNPPPTTAQYAHQLLPRRYRVITKMFSFVKKQKWKKNSFCKYSHIIENHQKINFSKIRNLIL